MPNEISHSRAELKKHLYGVLLQLYKAFDCTVGLAVIAVASLQPRCRSAIGSNRTRHISLIVSLYP